MENSELENLEFEQSTSQFDQNASEKNSEVFISEFSVLSTVQNGKLGEEKPREKFSPSFPRTLSFRPHQWSLETCLYLSLITYHYSYEYATVFNELIGLKPHAKFHKNLTR